MSEGVEIRTTTRFGELVALQWGHAEAPPLLALHGWLDNAASFSAVAPALAEHRRVIALDLPGHGHSAHMDVQSRHYHVVDQVGNVFDFADALGLDRFDLMGHSLGAGIASLMAATASTRIRRLVLIDGLGPLGDDGSLTLERWRESQAQRTRARNTPRVFAAVESALAVRVAAGELEGREVRPIVERNLRKTDDGYMWRTDARLRLKTPLRMGETQIRHLVAGIETSTLLLLAKPAPPYLPSALMDERASHVADIRVERMVGPHHLHIRHPQQVARKVLDFVAA